VSSPEPAPSWKRLFRIARDIISQANAKQHVVDYWTLGGGTAMMLQIDHRESRDIDIFLNDPQLLPFLDPEKTDFKFDILPEACGGDGVRNLRLHFAFGEIDFIVAGAKTSAPTTRMHIDGENILLETIPEIITKKIYYRASSIMPRDVFDIAAAAEQHKDSLIDGLQGFRPRVSQALETINVLQPVFVNRTIAALAIMIIRKSQQPRSKEARKSYKLSCRRAEATGRPMSARRAQ
jgi:hypothetical protein